NSGSGSRIIQVERNMSNSPSEIGLGHIAVIVVGTTLRPIERASGMTRETIDAASGSYWRGATRNSIGRVPMAGRLRHPVPFAEHGPGGSAHPAPSRILSASTGSYESRGNDSLYQRRFPGYTGPSAGTPKFPYHTRTIVCLSTR